MSSLDKLLDDAIAILEEAGVTWAVMGGCARNAYAEPRATKDVDFVLEAEPMGFSKLELALQRGGFYRASAVSEPGEQVPDLALYRDRAGRRIDILFAHTAFERSALERRRSQAGEGPRATHVVSAEDLIVYKVIADRPQDRADVAAVIEAQRLRGAAIDWAYIEHWCGAWDVLERLHKLRADLGA